MNSTMNIGHAHVCLSPAQNPFYLIGYRHPSRFEPAAGIHDDIYANALLFEQDGKEVFLFCADFLEFEEEMSEDVKTLLANTYGLNRDAVLLAATHNHSSVVGYHRSWYTGKYDQKYYDFLIEQIKTCVETCRANKRPATCRIGSKVITGYYGNRNHPGELADNEVIRVEFLNENGVPFAGLINWAVHSTVIPGSNTYLTAELAGNVSKLLEPDFGYYPAMLVGCAGDCSNRNERQGNDFAELERVSTGLAREIAAIPVNEPVPFGPIQVQTLFHTIHHDMKAVHEEMKVEIRKMQEELEKNPPNAGFLNNRIKSLQEELKEDHFHLDAKGWVISLGDLQIIAFPGELGSGFAPLLKHASNAHILVAGYTNGYYEYFMPESEYGLSFETAGCKVPRGEPEKLIAKFIQASRLLDRQTPPAQGQPSAE